MHNTVTGLIEIIKTPHGTWPLNIREEWVDITLRCYPNSTRLHQCFTARGELNEKAHENPNPWGVIVPQDLAMNVLERERPFAFTYWVSQGFPERDKNFFFRMDEVRLIRGVTPPTMTLVTEEMDGQLYR